MNRSLRDIKISFIASIIALTALSVIALSSMLYITNAIELHNSVSSSKLQDLTRDYPDVAAYLQTQKNAEAHFVTISNLVKGDQQRLITRALVLTSIPVLATSSVLAFVLARRLVKPVEETFAAQERFLQDASHEMRNPLAALYAVIQQARSGSSAKDTSKSLEVLDRQARQLIKLNEDLLMLERSKIKKQGIEQQNISELTLDVIDSEFAYATQQKVRIIQKVEPNIMTKVLDADWVCLARNLIENAVKYSKPNKSVTVALQRNKQQVIFSVSDNGIGIPKSQIENIGRRFYRGSNVGRTAGTGLGLAIVLQIVEKYRAAIDIKSVVNRGTTVTITWVQKHSTG